VKDNSFKPPAGSFASFYSEDQGRIEELEAQVERLKGALGTIRRGAIRQEDPHVTIDRLMAIAAAALEKP
jgi:hypothetical protein